MNDYEPNKSARIQEEVSRWVAAGRKNAIRRKADYLIQGRSWWWIFRGMGVLAQACQKKDKPIPVVWSAVIEGNFATTLLFFADTEEEVLAHIGILKPKNNPRNVLVKMAALRLSRVRKEGEHYKSYGSGSSRQRRLQIVSMFPLNTRQRCKNLVEQRGDFYVVKYLQVFLDENPGLDDSIFEEAWNLTEVQQVMES
jgi:hypothetical protein